LPEWLWQHFQCRNGDFSLVLLAKVAETHSERQIFSIAILKPNKFILEKYGTGKRKFEYRLTAASHQISTKFYTVHCN
jgi:hypothetical protein